MSLGFVLRGGIGCSNVEVGGVGPLVGIVIASCVFFILFWTTGFYLFRERIRRFM